MVSTAIKAKRLSSVNSQYQKYNTSSSSSSSSSSSEIERLQKLDIIKPVRGKSTPVNIIVLFVENNGHVRLCVDMRVAKKAV